MLHRNIALLNFLNGYIVPLIWLHGYTVTVIKWLQGYRVGYMVTGLHGYMVIWLHGYSVTWLYGFIGYMVIWLLDTVTQLYD